MPGGREGAAEGRFGGPGANQFKLFRNEWWEGWTPVGARTMPRKKTTALSLEYNERASRSGWWIQKSSIHGPHKKPPEGPSLELQHAGCNNCKILIKAAGILEMKI